MDESLCRNFSLTLIFITNFSLSIVILKACNCSLLLLDRTIVVMQKFEKMH